MNTPDEILRPPDTEGVSEITVLNDVIEEWIDEANIRGRDVTFIDAIKLHYAEMREMIADPLCAETLKRCLQQEVAIIDNWISEFSAMSQK